MRAYSGHVVRTKAIITPHTLAPITPIKAIMNILLGNARKKSKIVVPTCSTFPPAKAIEAPIMMPNAAVSPTPQKAIPRVTREPYKMRENSSRPRESVPIQWIMLPA